MVVVSGVLVSLAALACAKPTPRDALVQHETLQSAPSSFVQDGPAPGDHNLNLRIALVQNDIAGLEQALYDVSTPSSPNYGQHLSKEEVQKFVKPSDDSVSAVNSWLSANNLTAKTASSAGDWLSVSLPVSKANELFGANFTKYKHQGTNKTVIRTLSYSIPANLQDHLDFVHPTVTFSNPSARLPIIVTGKSGQNGTNATSNLLGDSITPQTLLDTYGIPKDKASQSSNKLAVSGFIEQYANKGDLKTFLQEYRSDINASFGLETIDGGSNPQDVADAGTEANLDTQYTVGLANGVPVTFISVGDNYQDGDLEGFLDIINYELDKDTPDQVLTTSYGENESVISRKLANNLCNAYAQLGARGTSILFASGDGGVSGSQSGSCDNDSFVATFPSGCPYMTSVGATTGTNPETAADFSSGGFSNYWGIPKYQSDAVSGYLDKLGDKYKGKYNASGRAYPDVSALGQHVEIVVDRITQEVAGTSCSSPIFASVISLINDQLIAAGKSPLGFLNPWLYSDAAGAFTDVTSGSNPGCNTDGFSAESGWDPVTGLGTPDFAKLRAAAGL